LLEKKIEIEGAGLAGGYLERCLVAIATRLRICVPITRTLDQIDVFHFGLNEPLLLLLVAGEVTGELVTKRGLAIDIYAHIFADVIRMFAVDAPAAGLLTLSANRTPAHGAA